MMEATEILELVKTFGGLGVLALFAWFLVRAVVHQQSGLIKQQSALVKQLMDQHEKSIEESTKQQRELSTLLENHLQHILTRQEKSNDILNSLLAAYQNTANQVASFASKFNEHMVEFERHRGKSED